MDRNPRAKARKVVRGLERALLIQGAWGHGRHWRWRLAWLMELLSWPMIAVLAIGWVEAWFPGWVYAACFSAVTLLEWWVRRDTPIAALSRRLRRGFEPASGACRCVRPYLGRHARRRSQ